MTDKHIFSFKTDVSDMSIPVKLNNPFGLSTPLIVHHAVQEFQDYFKANYREWEQSLCEQKGKMFGVLVIQLSNGALGYLVALSGKFPKGVDSGKFVPTVFDDSTDDYFINSGMTELTEIGTKISNALSQMEVSQLTEERRIKSIALQKRLFENYSFVNIYGSEKNVIEIFNDSSHGNPPSAAGECAAPKLLHHAFKSNLRPVAIAEFWWGKSPKGNERQHHHFYPACKDKCRPILEFMLNDRELFVQS